MTTSEKSIDDNLFSIYISDANPRCQHLTDIFTRTDLAHLDDTQLNEAIKNIQAITSAANLCRIPDIPELNSAVSNTILLLIQKKIIANDALQTLFLCAIDHLKKLNATPVDELDGWHKDNSQNIQECIDQLNKFSTSNSQIDNPEPVTETNIKASPDNADKHNKPAPAIEPSMFNLFRDEANTQVKTINEYLLELENDPDNNSILEPLMRSSHSIKGAARMVGFDYIVELSHRMEDCFVNCQAGKINLDKSSIDLLLHCNDLLSDIANTAHEQLSEWVESNQTHFQICLELLEQLAELGQYNRQKLLDLTPTDPDNSQPPLVKQDTHDRDTRTKLTDTRSNMVKIPSERLNKVLAVSNELLMSQHWLNGHMGSLQALKKRQTELASMIMTLRQKLEDLEVPDDIFADLIDAENKTDACRQLLHENLSQLDDYDRKTFVLSSKLNQEVVSSRMQPFSECTHGFRRMVRDISHSLKKDVRLVIDGLDTLVDSDILDMIEAPLTHLLRNAIDHGIESPEIRSAHGKPAQGLIRLSALHHAGKLNITIADDGKGVDIDQLKHDILDKQLVNQQMADQLTESELLDFLFLPGFSTKNDVTEFSGRGVGLDIVHDITTSMHGQIKNSSQLGRGMSIQLQLPLTLSIIHALLFEIGNEYYAIPLANIHAVIHKHTSDIFMLENKQLIKFNNKDISLLNASDLLECQSADSSSEILEIIVLNDRGENYAVVVDHILNEARLALHPIDSRLGKIRDISAAAIADNGRPVLVLDVDDLLINIQTMSGNGKLGSVSRCYFSSSNKNLKKILVIDDSLTVREVEKNLLESKDYFVDLAIDGVDGWNTFRSGSYDLVITDIDMPRMNGIELVQMIKRDTQYRDTPVMIVSYKDNPDDRLKGLEAGADYYLTKGSFHDESLIDAVVDLIGESAS